MSEQRPAPGFGASVQYLFWWGTLLFVLGAVVGAGLMKILEPAAPRVTARTWPPRMPGRLETLGRLPDFALTERSGETITREDLEGRVWVADFFFTSCAGICPIMSKAMAQLQGRLADVEQVTLVSISVDPRRDTPQQLRRYAGQYGADPVRWWFLTGDRQTIYRLSRESFRLGVEEVPEETDETGEGGVLHSSKFVLLDKRSRVRGYYDGDVPEALELLEADIRSLLKE